MEALDKRQDRPHYAYRAPACPYCDELLQQPGGVNTPLYCKCGSWLPRLINREWVWLYAPNEI
jgi:hypothetical protein